MGGRGLSYCSTEYTSVHTRARILIGEAIALVALSLDLTERKRVQDRGSIGFCYYAERLPQVLCTCDFLCAVISTSYLSGTSFRPYRLFLVECYDGTMPW